jgi:tetratricopeptide (TPR) repeat protein
MVQANAKPSPPSPAGPSERGPLEAAADWPVRSGRVPPLAEKFSSRPETGPDLAVALQRSAAVALLPRSHRYDADAETAADDWLRSIGKTQLAVAYAEDRWQSHSADLLVWIDASSRAAVLSGYAAAARAVTGSQLPGSAESVAGRFLGWLNETERRWLVVFDDVPDGTVLPGLWPSGPAGQVLITAATALAVTGLQGVLAMEIGPFSRREAMSYLVGRLSLDPDQRRGAMDLIEELECQPPALSQATATISGSWLTCADYRERFRRRSDDINAPDEAPLPATGVTWTLSVDEADQLVPGGGAQQCLALAAMFAGQGVPAPVFTSAAASGYITGRALSTPAAAGQAVAQVTTTLQALTQVGLTTIDRRGEPAVVRMNQVLQRAVRAAMPTYMLQDAVRAAADALLQSWPDPEQSSWVGESMRSSTACLRRVGRGLLWAGACHPLLLRAGRSLDEAGLTGPAVEYWAELIAVSDQVFGPGDPESMVLVERLANAYVAAGRVSEAVAWYRRLSSEWTKALGPDHPRTLQARERLGLVLVTAGLHAEAISVLTSALSDAEGAYGPDHPECVVVREAVAAGYRAAGQPAEAIRLYQIILTGRERTLGQGHPDTATTRQHLAEAFLADGKTKDAFAQYKRAVSDRQRSQGNDHPDTLRASAAFAAAYYQAGRMALAVQLYEQVHDRSRRVLGADHPDTLAVAAKLGQVYYAVGRLGDAGKLLRDTVARAERVLAPADPITATARQNLAAIDGR